MSDRTSLKNLLLRGQWLVIPLLILLLAESVLRKVEAAHPLWYERAEAIAGKSRVDFAFIGSSKAAAAFVASCRSYRIERTRAHATA